MASETGRGAQVRLDDTARQLARGGAGLRLIDTIAAKAALEASGTAPNGNTPDGSTTLGAAADDEVLGAGGDLPVADVAGAATAASVAALSHPAASATPVANGDLVLQATSNTSLTIKLRGSDGVVRSVMLTLA
jgi:hypothetical protein